MYEGYLVELIEIFSSESEKTVESKRTSEYE